MQKKCVYAYIHVRSFDSRNRIKLGLIDIVEMHKVSMNRIAKESLLRFRVAPLRYLGRPQCDLIQLF